jgi:cobalt-zinc-cadmium efflux system membrane fusion protein
VERVEGQQCRSVLKALGKVLAPKPQTAIVSHPFPARVSEIHVELGDWVEEGQALLTLSSQALGQAKSEFYKAIAHCELARLNHEREEQLYKDEIGVKKNFLAAEAEYKLAQANREAAEKKLHVLGFTEEEVQRIADTHQINPNINLHAPIEGKIVRLQAVRGDTVDESTEILTIMNPKVLWVDAEIYERDIAKIHAGQDVEITVPAYPGEVFAGKIGYVGDFVHDETRTITVRSEVSNARHLLMPGMFANIRISLDEICQFPIVPLVAVFEEGPDELVLVKEGDGYARRRVETGVVEGKHVQILSGLAVGDEIKIQDSHEHSNASSAEHTVRLPETARGLAGIELERVSSRESKSVLKAMGEILAPQTRTAMVSHAFPGRVAEIHVAVGDWVDKQQDLITLESQDVGDAKSCFYKAIACCELARVNLSRQERLLEEGIGTERNHLAAEAEHKVAQASKEAAEKMLHVLGFDEDEVGQITGTHQISPTIELSAPISGRVVEMEVVRGSLVDQSTEILTIIDPTVLWANAEIYEKDLSKINIGQKVELTVPAYPEDVFEGAISYIGDVVNEASRTITVRAEVANDDQRLKPGMFADVGILLNGVEKTLVVPVAAVLEDGHRKIVFVNRKDRFVQREIKTGAVDGDHVQVLDGLLVGEEVVVEGNHQLRSVLRADALHAAHMH